MNYCELQISLVYIVRPCFNMFLRVNFNHILSIFGGPCFILLYLLSLCVCHMCVSASILVHSVPGESEESSVSSLSFHPRSGCAEASLSTVESSTDPDLHQEDVDPPS